MTKFGIEMPVIATAIDRVVGRRVLPQRREAAGRDAEHEREEHRAAAEPQRHREARHR